MIAGSGQRCSGAEAATIRRLRADDSLDELTAMLHRAFSRLGRAGLNCTCADQSAAVTLERISKGECFVAVRNGRPVGTITLYGPNLQSENAWYRRRTAASIHQLGVDPEYQDLGIGSSLLRHAEAWAREHGYRELALDTPQPAAHLVAFYRDHGYRSVGVLRFRGKLYCSVVLNKSVVGRTNSRNINDPRLRRYRCRMHAPDVGAGASPGRRQRIAGMRAPAFTISGLPPPAQRVELRFTVYAAGATRLRTAAAGACGDSLQFLRVEPVARTRSVVCRLCLSSPAWELTADAVIRTLAAAQGA